MSTAAATIPSLNTPAAAPAQENKPKPCCVCKEEKSKRDECMLFSNSNDPAKDCRSTIQQYKDCMKGFGFEV
ncbi:cysteine alpha-hairpin motif superfamily [Plectosphaerella plurivora]|uniref:Cysteine alpha-hairpin motif superfamily n=1 Tax=Plectosphaerella plurivora TaxID=936078 RepID=A0A9P8VFJ7_9PEZI|nr:cysteine alpha-hairpin motif superfamily [Plectosphaerella plurivora]